MDKGNKLSAMNPIMKGYGKQSSKSFQDLNDQQQSYLKRFNIDHVEWDALRSKTEKNLFSVYNVKNMSDSLRKTGLVHPPAARRRIPCGMLADGAGSGRPGPAIDPPCRRNRAPADRMLPSKIIPTNSPLRLTDRAARVAADGHRGDEIERRGRVQLPLVRHPLSGRSNGG